MPRTSNYQRQRNEKRLPWLPHRPHARCLLTKHTPGVSKTTDVFAEVTDTTENIIGTTTVEMRGIIIKDFFPTRGANKVAGSHVSWR